MPQRISLSDIARESGYSRAAVSYALRNDSNISKKAREHIQAVAKRMGYRPDPAIAKLMLRLNGERKQSPGSRIAFLNVGNRADFIAETPTLRDFFQSARTRAREHGYDCEEFWLHEPGRSPARLANILEARGIQGILLGSSGQPDTHLDFPLEAFSIVTVGYSITTPRLHRVVTHHYENALLAIRKVRKAGYRRIGLIADPQMEPTMHNLHLAAMLAIQHEWPRKECVPPCFGLDQLAVWQDKQTPDVVLNGTVRPTSELHTAGLPESIPVVSLVPGEGEPAQAGIHVGYDKLGPIAMNLLADNILHDQFGVPEDSQIIMVNGTWYDHGALQSPASQAIEKTAP
ncbi:MAG: LacI family DNA-binding transcriptional regulator [Puniceicoccales bacterium]